MTTESFMCARLSTSVSHREGIERRKRGPLLVNSTHNRVIAFATVRAKAMLTGDHFDHMIAAVSLKCGRVIGDHILIAQRLCNVVKSSVDLVLVTALQEDAPRGLGEVFQNRIAFRIKVAERDIGAHSENHCLST